MKENPEVSVIMPVYNAEKYLDEAIQSILNQTFKNFEFLIFNDCSKDNSWEIIQKYAKQDKRIITFNSEVNKGYVAHLNRGIEMVKGKYIARMDNDDISLPTRFEKQVKFLEENQQVGMCGSWYIQEGGRGHGRIVELPCQLEDIYLLMLYGNAFSHPSVMIRKDVLETNNIRYNVSLMPSEDYALWVTLLEHSKLANIPEVLFKYRIHDNNFGRKKRSQTQKNNRANYQIRVMKQVFKYDNFSDVEWIILQKFLALEELKHLQDLKKIISILQKINQNPQFENISESKMISFLRNHFYYLCTTSTHLGLKMWIIYIKSGLGINLPKFNLKMLGKSLINYKTKTK